MVYFHFFILSLFIGRPELPYESKSSRSKERAAGILANGNSNDKIFRALMKSSRKNRKSLMPILNKVTNPGSATQFSKMISSAEKQTPKMLSPETALALISSCRLSQDDYQTLRNVALAHNANIFPSYHKILAAKKECYPANIEVSEIRAQQPLQRILKIDEVREKIIENMDQNNNNNDLVLRCKWGFDGATGQSQYKQRYNDESFDDSSLFSAMLVPLDLSNRKISFWRNPAPSSTRFCRPIKVMHVKETPELTKSVQVEIENEYKALNQSTNRFMVGINQTQIEIGINFDLSLTMLDGKAVNAVSNNSSTRTCNIYKANPTQMNKKKALETLVPDTNALKFGLSALHAYIRCFECILHISYRLPIKKWQIRGPAAEEQCLSKKKIVQEQFWRKMGLLVDFPKDSGYGNTNDGNTARRAFQNYEIFAEITGVNQELIWRLYNIFCLDNSSYSFNIEKFKNYCDQTFELYVKEYE